MSYNMKKETNNIVIYVCMIFLLLLIVIPPVLRQFVSREEVVENTEKKVKLVLLTCNKTSDDGLYTINAKSKFNNGEPTTVTLTYQLKNTVQEGLDSTEAPSGDENDSADATLPDENATQTTVAIADPALTVFRGLVDAEVKEDASTFSVIMTKKTLDSNSEMKDLNNYFNVLSNQRKYYESLGFTCTKLES